VTLANMYLSPNVLLAAQECELKIRSREEDVARLEDIGNLPSRHHV